jgi:hypothetical protein
MKVFLSWSKPRSKALALALREWLRDVVQALEPWMSDVDIEKGSTWFGEISESLSTARYCIICVTPENRTAPWLLFEAGVAANKLTAQRVAPVLLGMQNTLEAPLGLFQTTLFEKNEMFKLVKSINAHLEAHALPDAKLRKAFDLHWPELEALVAAIPEPDEQIREPTEKELLREILAGVRGLQRRGRPPTAKDMNRVLKTLTPLEEGVLRLRFGLDDSDPAKDRSYWTERVREALEEEGTAGRSERDDDAFMKELNAAVVETRERIERRNKLDEE